MKKIFIFYMFLICTILAVVVYAATYYVVISGGSNPSISEHGVAKGVVNSCSKDLFIPTNTLSEWQAFIDNPPSCVGVHCPLGEDNGLCSLCNGVGGSTAPADDTACGTIDCDGLNYYYTSGSASATGTNYCVLRDYSDLTANRCEGVGDCKDANTADCTSYADSTVASCGTCRYASGACSSCYNYGLGASCGSNLVCNGAGSCVTNVLVVYHNGASTASCDTICSNNGGRSCINVGTDGAGTNWLKMRTSCVTLAALCSTVITYRWEGCGEWTYCRCAYS